MAISGAKLRRILLEHDLSQAEFARMIDVSVSAVSQWLSDSRGIPGPVEAFLGLLGRLPEEMRKLEITRAKMGNTKMINGIYRVHLGGSAGEGDATLIFQDGMIFGFDATGAEYNGNYVHAVSGVIEAVVYVNMPANVASVIGNVSQPFPWTLQAMFSILTADVRGTTIVRTNVGAETVSVKYSRIRDLPQAA